jgi:replicative DNA helicase
MGEGKSWALKRMAINNIIAGYPAHYASLEMSKIEVEMRVHNLLSGKFGEQVFDATGLYTGKGIDLPAYKKFLNSLKREVKGTLTISDTRGLGITEIAAHIERYKPAVYYLDYLTLAKMDSTDWQGIGVFTKQLKELAANTGTVIVAAAQLNREATKSRDVSSVDNLSGSDQIGMDADAVITMRKRSATVTEYYVAKCRQTKGAFKWYAHMDTSKGQFEEISRNKADEYIEKDREQADLDAINEQKRLRR